MHAATYQHAMWIGLWSSCRACGSWPTRRPLGSKKGQLRGLGNLGPAGWFLACLLLWFPAFFFYLYKRPAFKRINASGVVVDAEPVVSVQAQPRVAGSSMNGTQALVWGGADLAGFGAVGLAFV